MDLVLNPFRVTKRNSLFMFDPDQYQLLDFGNGEKLEMFGGTVIRRATPSVAEARGKSTDVQWESSLCFRKRDCVGEWEGDVPASWQIKHLKKTLNLKPTPAGQIGIFPEQATNWSWIESQPQSLAGLNAINLFGYTGGTTLSLASRGASVVHVDSARNVVGWARQNATDSEMGELPIRWIVEDALKFVRRESVRGSKYDILVADPPSYGTGPKNERWKFQNHFEELLALMAEISSAQLQMLIISCHTTGFGVEQLRNSILKHFDLRAGRTDAFSLQLESITGDRLGCGCCVRYVRE
jgi:23S rRNA (cytosine1962-C5)-methyltransferase